MDEKHAVNLTTKLGGIFISIISFFYEKSLIVSFFSKYHVIFLMINNFTSMTLLENVQEVSSMYHRSIIILWLYN